MRLTLSCALLVVVASVTFDSSAAAPEPIAIWPGVAPGEKGDVGPEADMTKPNPKTGKADNIIRLGNVTAAHTGKTRTPVR